MHGDFEAFCRRILAARVTGPRPIHAAAPSRFHMSHHLAQIVVEQRTLYQVGGIGIGFKIRYQFKQRSWSDKYVRVDTKYISGRE